VEAFSAEEVVWYGVYGIKLTSYDDTKRQWLFRARSDPEQSEWLEVGARLDCAVSPTRRLPMAHLAQLYCMAWSCAAVHTAR
jgi:hypothetical protein